MTERQALEMGKALSGEVHALFGVWTSKWGDKENAHIGTLALAKAADILRQDGNPESMAARARLTQVEALAVYWMTDEAANHPVLRAAGEALLAVATGQQRPAMPEEARAAQAASQEAAAQQAQQSLPLEGGGLDADAAMRLQHENTLLRAAARHRNGQVAALRFYYLVQQKNGEDAFAPMALLTDCEPLPPDEDGDSEGEGQHSCTCEWECDVTPETREGLKLLPPVLLPHAEMRLRRYGALHEELRGARKVMRRARDVTALADRLRFETRDPATSEVAHAQRQAAAVSQYLLAGQQALLERLGLEPLGLVCTHCHTPLKGCGEAPERVAQPCGHPQGRDVEAADEECVHLLPSLGEGHLTLCNLAASTANPDVRAKPAWLSAQARTDYGEARRDGRPVYCPRCVERLPVASK